MPRPDLGCHLDSGGITTAAWPACGSLPLPTSRVDTSPPELSLQPLSRKAKAPSWIVPIKAGSEGSQEGGAGRAAGTSPVCCREREEQSNR